MKKTLLAAALAVGFAGVAQAETSVTLYGIIDTGFMYHRAETAYENANGHLATRKATTTGTFDGGSHGQYGPRWGVKGVEDLGNGLRAEFMLEGGFNINTGHSAQGGRIFGRQAWVGFAGDNWGSVRFGRQLSLSSNYLLYPTDPFGGGFGVANAGDSFRASNTNRMDNTIRYDTPNFSGFQFGVAYSFNHDGPQIAKVSGEKDRNDRSISAAIRYANGPIGVALTYDQTRNRYLGDIDPYADATRHQWNLGGSYDFEVVKVSAMFGQTRNGDWGGRTTGVIETSPGSFYNGGVVHSYDKGFKSNAYMLGLSAPVGAGTVMASWHMVDPRKKSDFMRDWQTLNNERVDLKKIQTYSIGYKYPLSKRTDVYAYAAHQKNTDFVKRQKKTTIAAGLSHKF